jgi:hypothetical protein
MFFGKKSNKKQIRCENCDSKVEKKFSYCPDCGQSLKVQEQSGEGLGGLIDNPDMANNPLAALGISDKMINSLMGNLMKSLNTQMKDADEMPQPEIQNTPNGIKIRIGGHPTHTKKKTKKKEITEEQIKKMEGLPRGEAKASLRRFSDKVVYELTTPGVESVQDVFISKLESGYELKAIGEKKVYINNLPVTLPLKKYSVANKKVFVEFAAQ